MRVGWLEIVLILVVVLLIFGGKRLSGLGKSIGKTLKDFKREIKDDDESEDDNT